MSFGASPLGPTPFGSLPGPDGSSAAPFETLLESPDLPRVYVLRARPYDPVAGTTATKLYGQSDVIWRGNAHAPMRLIQALDVQGAIFSGFDGLSGSSVPQFGGIRLAANEEADGTIPEDDLTGYTWDGRVIEVFLGGEDFGVSQFQPVFVGRSLDLVWDDTTYTIVARDPAADLSVPIQSNLYAGTGGNPPYPPEGGSDLQDSPKPLAFGKPRKVTAIPVDTTALIYQVHDGAIKAVDAVYDQGAALTFNADQANLYTAGAPAAGFYDTDLANGLIRLGAPPNGGSVTVDVQGATDDGTTSGTLLETAADLIEHVAKTYGGFAAADLDSSSFSALNTDTSAPLSLYLTGVTSIAEVIDRIATSILGFWTFTRTGLLRVGQVKFRTATRSIAEAEVHRIERLRTALPFWRRTIGYARSWTVQNQGDLAGLGATQSYIDFVRVPYRFESDEDATVPTTRPLAREETIETLLNDSSDAATEATRQLTLTKAQRDLYEVDVARHQWLIRPGDTVELTYPRWGLSGGRDFIVLAVSENTTSALTTLSLWG